MKNYEKVKNSNGLITASKKLKFCPYGSAHVRIYENGTTELVSYSTSVCIIQNGVLYCSGTYSKTTIKHISAFMKEYANGSDYYTAKKAYTENIGIAI